MSTVKLTPDTNGGSVQLKAPANTSGADVVLTLPNTDGNANQLLKTDGSGNLSWADDTDTTNTNASNLSSGTLPAARIADDSIVEAKLDIHAAPSGTDKFLGYTSNGMEWAVPSGGFSEHTYYNSDGDTRSIASNSWVKIPLDAGYQRGTDTSGFSDANDRYTPGVAGWYYVSAKVQCEHTNSGSWWTLEIRKNGVGYGIDCAHYPKTENGLKYFLHAAGMLDLDADDYIEMWLNHSTGSNRNVHGMNLTCVKVGDN